MIKLTKHGDIINYTDDQPFLLEEMDEGKFFLILTIFC